MAFIFPGDLQVGGDLNLDSGSNINLPSGSDIVLGEGANIRGSGDLDGNFSGSFEGSFSGSFPNSNLISQSAQISALGYITGSETFDASNIESSIASLNSATSSFLTSSTPFNPSGIQSSLDSINAATSSFLTSSTPFDPSGIQSSLDSLNSATSSFLTSSTPFDASGIQSSIDALELATSSYISNADTSSLSVETASYSLTASFALNAFDGVSASYAQTASHALEVPFGVISDLPADLVSSSQQVLDFGFIKSTGSDPNMVASASYAITASHALNAFNGVSSSYATTASFALNAFDGISASFAQTASHALSVPFEVIENLPADLVSSSQQIEDFGFITSSVSGGVDFADITNAPTLISGSGQIEDLGFITGSDTPGLVDSASLALRAERLETFENVQNVNGQHALLMTAASESINQRNGEVGFAGTNTSLGSLRFNPNRGGNNDAAELTIGAVGVTGILDVDRIDMAADIIINEGVFTFIGTNGGYISFANVTLPNAVVNQGALGREGGRLKFASGSAFHELYFEDSQIDIGGTTGNISGSRVVGDIQASSVDYDNILNLPTLFSASAQVDFDDIADVPAGLVSGSAQINLGDATGTADNAVTASYVQLSALQPGSLSLTNTQITLTGTTSNVTAYTMNIDNTLAVNNVTISSNFKVNNSSVLSANAVTNGNRIYASGSQLYWSNGNHWSQILNKTTLTGSLNDLNIVSSSAQITLADTTGNISGSRVVGDIQASSVDYDNVLNKPTLISSSAQVDLSQATGNASTADTASYIFYDGVDTIGANWVSSSAQISFTGITNKPALVSGSGQVVNLLDGQNVNLGVVTADEFNTTIVSSSIIFTSGSNIFGDESSDTHEFTGSVSVKGDFVVEGHTFVSSSQQIMDLGFITSSGTPDSVASSSFASTASLALSAISSSYATTASHALNVGFDVITGLPAGLVSSSAQLGSTITASKVNVGNSDTDDFFSVAFVSNSGSDAEVFTSNTLRYNPSLDILQVETFEGTAHTASFVTGSNVLGKVAEATNADVATRSDAIKVVASNYNQEQEVLFTDGVANNKTAKVDTNTFTYNSSTNTLTVPNLTGTASYATTASYADMAGSVDFDYVENLPANLVSSSAQVDEFTSGLTVKGGNLKLAGAISLELSASSGQSHIRYRDSAGGNKTFISADHDNDFIKFSNRASNGYFNFFANNATNGAAGEQKVAEFRHDKAEFFQDVIAQNLVSSSAQIGGLFGMTITNDRTYDASLTFTGSRYIRYTDSGNTSRYAIQFDGPNDVVKFMNRAANGSLDFFANSATAGSAGEVNVLTMNDDQIVLRVPLSGSSISASLDFDNLDNVPVIVSQSAQITLADTTGNISGSRVVGDIQASSVEYDNVLNKPTLFSGSQQVEDILLNNSVDFGTGTVTADRVDVSDRIRHDGDADTSIVFQNNQIWVNAGGRSNIGFGSTETVINEDSNDHNFRVESNGNANAIFVDGGLNRVGILKNNPQSALDVNGSVRATNLYGDGSNITNIALPSDIISGSDQITMDSSSFAETASYVSMDDIDFGSLTHYDDDAAAATGGVPIGKLYRNGNFIQVRLS